MQVVYAVEFDDNAVACYMANHPETPVWHGDIHQLDVDTVLAATNLAPGDLDVLDASPPYQGFSTIGKRKFCDPRNDLYHQVTRFLDGLQPKTFVVENVPGLVKGPMKAIFVSMLREFKACGYRVKVRKMNAKWYGVPQNRERMIFIGVRDDLDIEPTHPAPLMQPITAGTALEGCPVGEVKYPDGKKAPLIRRLGLGERMTAHVPGKYYGMWRLDPNKPAYTITKTFGTTWGMFATHWDSDRSLSIPEVKRLFSYPDEYVLVGSFEEQWARLGNSVPPNLIKAVAEHIDRTVLTRCR